MHKLSLDPYLSELGRIPPFRWTGQVTEVIGLLIESRGPCVAIGDFCEVITASGRPIRTQVIGFRDGRVLAMPLEETDGLQLGDEVAARSEDARVEVGPALLGRVIDGFGKPIDGGPGLEAADAYSLYGTPSNPLLREHITQPLVTGIRAIDGLLPCGKGQRVGIFGGSGVGKSTLLGMMARNTNADLTVIGLIGERGREVAELLNALGEEGRRRALVIVSTSDQDPLLRIRAGLAATTVAEYLCGRGKHVLLVVDSLTRLAMAQREIGLAAGEPPTGKGYTPSVFTMLARLIERAGAFGTGSITGFYTVLMEGDDMNDPLVDATRALLDGHVLLDRRLAAQNQYPPIAILDSISRIMTAVATAEHSAKANQVRRLLAAYRASEDLIRIGAYQKGGDEELDRAIALMPPLREFLVQSTHDPAPMQDSLTQLMALPT